MNLRDWVISIKLPLFTARWGHHATYVSTTCITAIFQSNNYNFTKYQCLKAEDYYLPSNFWFDPGEIKLHPFENQNLRRKTHGNNPQGRSAVIFSTFPLFGSYPYDFLKWMVSFYPGLVPFSLRFISAIVNFDPQRVSCSVLQNFFQIIKFWTTWFLDKEWNFFYKFRHLDIWFAYNYKVRENIFQ